MKLSKEELSAKINELEIDEEIKVALMEDIADSIEGSTEGADGGELEELKIKYEALRDKYKEMFKKQREANKDVKEYRLSVNIDIHDFETRAKNAQGYLEKGHNVKASIRFKGREMAHTDLGKDVLMKFADRLSEYATVETEPKLEGRMMNMLLTPKK